MLKSILDRGTTLAVVLLASVLFAHLKGCDPSVVPPVPDGPVVGPVTPAPAPPVVGPVTPAPAPPPTPPVGNLPALVLTARQYRANFGANFSAVADRVASGELATRDAILDALKQNAQPFNESLAAAIGGACSANGSVSDKDGLARLFKAVGDATGGSK